MICALKMVNYHTLQMNVNFYNTAKLCRKIKLLDLNFKNFFQIPLPLENPTHREAPQKRHLMFSNSVRGI